MKELFFVSALVLIYSVTNAQQKPFFDVQIEKSENSSATLEEVKKLIVENYYYDGINESDLEWAAIEGMLRHISPPESPNLARLWTDEEYDKILNSLKGVKVSLGFKSTFNSSDGSLTINSITKDSEAESLLKVNDRIVRIDGQSLSNKTLKEINTLLDGDPDQSSTLKVVRDIQVFDVVLTRSPNKVENLIVTEIPGREIVLIEIKKISLGIAQELEALLNDIQDIQTIIIDLRNNSGGVLNEGVNVAKLFMKKNDIVLRTQTRSKGVTNYVADVDKYHEYQIAVLINEKTASAAEIIASALQDHKRGILVGKKTFGKGVIETTFTLENEYRLKFITSAMYSPKGTPWQSKGILPDYFIDQTQANYKEVSTIDIIDRVRNDLHLSTALKLLK